VKKLVIALLAYFALVYAAESIVEKQFYDFGSIDWNFILISKLVFTALKMAPLPIYTGYRAFFSVENTVRKSISGKRRNWLLLFILSLCLVGTIILISYSRMLKIRAEYEVMTNEVPMASPQ